MPVPFQHRWELLSVFLKLTGHPLYWSKDTEHLDDRTIYVLSFIINILDIVTEVFFSK